MKRTYTLPFVPEPIDPRGTLDFFGNSEPDAPKQSAATLVPTAAEPAPLEPQEQPPPPPVLVVVETAIDTEAEASGDTNDPTDEMALFDAVADPAVVSRSLIDVYKVPPFTILDTRQGYWQNRKRSWLRLEIKSEIGRANKLTYGKFNQNYEEQTQAEWAGLSDEERTEQGYALSKARSLNPHTKKKYGEGSTSVFDPVLTEIMYRWFCPPGGTILDPFAGGSVRGIVAACLGHPYTGIELRGIQVEANREQATKILRPTTPPVPTPLWVQGDSNKVLAVESEECDFVFTCPPYGDLEVYSDDPDDLSNMKADSFDRTYQEIMGRTVGCLRDNRFAAVVVGNFRDKTTGEFRNLVDITNQAMARAGAKLYNESVLINVSGTAALRARDQFNVSRKLVRVHQMVLVYVKGDPRKAATTIGDVEWLEAI